MSTLSYYAYAIERRPCPIYVHPVFSCTVWTIKDAGLKLVFFFNELPFLQAINEDATFQPSANALCRKRDICYSEKTSTLEFFFTYLEIKIIHETIYHMKDDDMKF